MCLLAPVPERVARDLCQVLFEPGGCLDRETWLHATQSSLSTALKKQIGKRGRAPQLRVTILNTRRGSNSSLQRPQVTQEDALSSLARSRCPCCQQYLYSKELEQKGSRVEPTQRSKKENALTQMNT